MQHKNFQRRGIHSKLGAAERRWRCRLLREFCLAARFHRATSSVGHVEGPQISASKHSQLAAKALRVMHPPKAIRPVSQRRNSTSILGFGCSVPGGILLSISEDERTGPRQSLLSGPL